MLIFKGNIGDGKNLAVASPVRQARHEQLDPGGRCAEIEAVKGSGTTATKGEERIQGDVPAVCEVMMNWQVLAQERA